jgi:Family of unknown function (DUF5343)
MASSGQYPFATSQAGLKKILEGIPGWVTPDKVNGPWLAGVGFSGGAAAQSLAALRTVGIVGTDGKPTELWTALRTKDRVKFADGVRTHYSQFFSTYGDAHRKDTEALLALVRSQTNYGEKTQRRVVATFKTFCEFGNFDTEASADDEPNEPEKRPKAKAPKGSVSSGNGGGMALTVNLQLQLPASESGDVYEKLFAAMSKHLKGLIGTE